MAPEGAVYVVDERFRKALKPDGSWGNCNLRTTFEKIIERAGLTQWPRLFHNLRASRETELVERFPVQRGYRMARQHAYHRTQALSDDHGGTLCQSREC